MNRQQAGHKQETREMSCHVASKLRDRSAKVKQRACSTGAHLDTATMRHHGKRSADLRIGVNGRFPANLAESEFGVPSQCQGAPVFRERSCSFLRQQPGVV